jgi:hypothetical protein
MFPVSISVFAELSIGHCPFVLGNYFNATFYPSIYWLYPYFYISFISPNQTNAIPPLPRSPSFVNPFGHLSPNFSFS